MNLMRYPSQLLLDPSRVETSTSANTGSGLVSSIGIDYLKLETSLGKLYLTPFGSAFRGQLAPENWYAPDWFAARRAPLPGTSAIYKVPTKPVRGVSLNLVVRFSRVGEEVPFDTQTVCEYPNAEFNSPFEEFALVMQLREEAGASRRRVLTKRPLAIFLPAERVHRWQTGRCESKMAAKLARHPEVPLDILQPYILVYNWIKGQDAVQTADALGLSHQGRETFLADATRRAIDDLALHGFRMLDIKPQHIIFRLDRNGSLLRRPDGEPAYALVDYELLERF